MEERDAAATAPVLTRPADGFRPCLQCRPDREPEPGWVDAPELVCRALRLIADGALDAEVEDAFALRLGVSARHLRRLFAQHVGATPSEVARSRRAHFARRLLDDTDLPMTREANAYRTAGVTVPMTGLLEHLGYGANELVVELE